jgi:hypothetical protein
VYYFEGQILMICLMTSLYEIDSYWLRCGERKI